MFKSICIFTGGYPTKDNPEFAFIQPLARSMADAGINVIVICLQSISHALLSKTRIRPEKWKDVTEKGNEIIIYQPKSITFSMKAPALNRLTNTISIKRIKKKYHINPEIVYGHFWHDAIQGSVAFPDKPLFVATGESEIWVDHVWDRKTIKKVLKRIRGVISVSSQNVVESRELGLLSENPSILVAPNGINPQVFYSYEQEKARTKIGIDKESFVGVFVGEFSNRKGSERVIEAAKEIPELKLIMIGKGMLSESKQIIFHGVVPHDRIVDYLNAGDFFVLPTLAEGCCNAIIEAMACGLPIISSNLPFNDDILNENYSIRVNPSDITQISSAINKMRDVDLRKQMKKSVLDNAHQYTIEARTQKIIEFIDQNLGN